MKTFVKFVSAFLAIAAAALGLIAPRGAITSFILVLSGLAALILLVSSFKDLKVELAEAKEIERLKVAVADAREDLADARDDGDPAAIAAAKIALQAAKDALAAAQST